MTVLAALALAVLLTTSGIAHFVLPRYFRTLVPGWLPRPDVLVAVTGIADIATAFLLFVPDTRAIGGWVAASLITAYLVAHLDALRASHIARRRFLDGGVGVTARIVVNVGYIAWATAVAVTANRN